MRCQSRSSAEQTKSDAYSRVDETERLLTEVETDIVDSGEKSTNDRGGGRSAEDALEAALKSDGVVGTIS